LVNEDDGTRGCLGNYLHTLKTLLQHQADRYLIVQDDVIFCKALKNYMEESWPSDASACSPYTPSVYGLNKKGWSDQSHKSYRTLGALAYTFTREAAQEVLKTIGQLDIEIYINQYDPHRNTSWIRPNRHVDVRIGIWAHLYHRKLYYHSPSLVQHTGIMTSTLSNETEDFHKRMAGDFIGEDRTPYQEHTKGCIVITTEGVEHRCMPTWI